MHIFGVHLLGRYCSLSSFPFGLMDNNTNGRQWDSVPVGYTSALEHVFTGPGCSVAGAVGADWCDRAKCSFICLFLPHSFIHSFVHPFICVFFFISQSYYFVLIACLACLIMKYIISVLLQYYEFQCLYLDVYSYKLHFYCGLRFVLTSNYSLVALVLYDIQKLFLKQLYILHIKI